jgi:hypothetical protein
VSTVYSHWPYVYHYLNKIGVVIEASSACMNSSTLDCYLILFYYKIIVHYYLILNNNLACY